MRVVGSKEVIKTFELNKMTKKELIEFASNVFLVKEKIQGAWGRCLEERRKEIGLLEILQELLYNYTSEKK